MSDDVSIDFDYIDHDKGTRDAYFIVFEDTFDEVSCFVPRSQVTVDEVANIATMPEWLAQEKGLI